MSTVVDTSASADFMEFMKTNLRLRPFNVSPFNEHYEGKYDDKAVAWRRAGASDKVSNILNILAETKSEIGSVLEVGCGTGVVLAGLRSRGLGSKHLGIDIADPNEHRDDLAAGIELKAYDGENLPLEAASFDLVVASHVLEHVLDERQFLSELSRVCGKYIYVEVPCELHVRTNQKDMQATLNIGHFNAYTPESFLLTLQTSGLAVLNMQLLDHSDEVHHFHGKTLKSKVKAFMRRLAISVSPLLASRLMTYHCGALCVPVK